MGGEGSEVRAECKVQGVFEHSMRGSEMFPTLARCWQASGMRGNEAGRFREVEDVSIIVDLYTVAVDNRVALNTLISIFQLVMSLLQEEGEDSL